MRYLIILLMMCLMSMSPLVALADTTKPQNAPALITLDQAVKRVKQLKTGKILAAETRQQGDTAVHIIKVLTDDGRVKKVRIQAIPAN